MNTIETIDKTLNLLYFEYDPIHNRFIPDIQAPIQDKQKEFIKLTYHLSKNQISFFMDESSNIILEKKDTLLSHLIQYIKNKLFAFKSEQKNIYILSDTPVKNGKNLPLIQTTPIKKDIDFSLYDGIIFTSKNGVRGIESYTQEWKKLPCYTISNKTAKVVKEYGGSVAYIGQEKHGNQFAQELIGLLAGKKVLFLGAKEIVSDLIEILNCNGIECIHEAIYETTCVAYEQRVVLPKNSIIIFSSPSTIKCFMKNVQWDESFKAISIGKTTAQYFPKHITPIVSKTTSLSGCVQTALNL